MVKGGCVVDVVSIGVALSIIASADTLDCFTEPVEFILNPGEGAYAVQYHFPFHSELPARVNAWGFLNNDGGTTWPSAGVILIQPDSLGQLRFPTPSELQSLQLSTIVAPRDTAGVRLQIVTESVEPQPDDAVVLVLEMPAGDLVDVGEGPGFAAATRQGFEHCSFFTTDGGQTWFEPTDHTWAWVYELETQIDPTNVRFEPIVWGRFKRLFH